MHISFQDAYAEACQALGEEIVKSRLLARTESQQAAEAASEAAAETPGDVPSPGDAAGEKQATPKPSGMRKE